MVRFQCPYLDGELELPGEREPHIAESHPDLLPEHRTRIADVPADPDQVRRSASAAGARLFARWFEGLRGGKHVVLVVVSGLAPRDRHWVITAYMARRLAEGETEWTRS